jgi:hypothetical protein
VANTKAGTIRARGDSELKAEADAGEGLLGPFEDAGSMFLEQGSSMEPKVIEGTWEEVARKSDELAGHRVRLTVLSPSTSQEQADETAFKRHLLEVGLISRLPELPAEADDEDDAPVVVAGEPLSETVLRERR